MSRSQMTTTGRHARLQQMARSPVRFRATRAAPPGMAAADEKRRALLSAALQQSEDLFEAAHAVGPLARPIPLFYAISQAGALLRHPGLRTSGRCQATD